MASRMQRKPDPAPLETDDVRLVALGTAAWFAALVVLALVRLAGNDGVRSWWIVMCSYGFVLGLLGVRYCQRRRAALARGRS